MKYKRIVGWLHKNDKKALKIFAAPHKIPLIFTKNCQDLKNNIADETDYIAISSWKAELAFNQLKEIIENNPNNTFGFFQALLNEDFSLKAGDLQDYKNVISVFCTADDIVNNFLGIIPDLVKDRHENYHIDFQPGGAVVIHN